jgi:hypothetical protein
MEPLLGPTPVRRSHLGKSTGLALANQARFDINREEVKT